MFKCLQKNRTGQVISAEYVLILFVVMGVMSVMFIYFQRTLQARIYDARNAMLKAVTMQDYGENREIIHLYDHDFIEYEPYYSNTESTISQKRAEATTLYPVAWGEHYQKGYNETINVKTTSRTAPPGEVR